jgi:hypothetical protein
MTVVSDSDLVALQRSAAMLPPGASLPVDRDQAFQMCSELIEARQLLTRLGSDLRSVANLSRRP